MSWCYQVNFNWLTITLHHHERWKHLHRQRPEIQHSRKNHFYQGYKKLEEKLDTHWRLLETNTCLRSYVTILTFSTLLLLENKRWIDVLFFCRLLPALGPTIEQFERVKHPHSSTSVPINCDNKWWSNWPNLHVRHPVRLQGDPDPNAWFLARLFITELHLWRN